MSESPVNQGQSKLERYSLGVVAENRLMSKNRILVTPIESLTHLEGEIKSNPTKLEATAVDADDRTYSVDTIGDNAIEADWLPLGCSNRKTPPNVRRGERVQLYRFADTDQYYWTTTGADEHLRKLETVIYGWSSNSKEEADGRDLKNMYWFELSTHNGCVSFFTSKHEGERANYSIQLNTKEGRFIITDDEGNEILLDTDKTLISLTNADGTHVKLDKEDIDVHCDGNMTVDVGKNIDAKAGKDVTITCGGSFTTKASSSATVKAPNITLDGNLTITGPTKANGITSPVPVCGPIGCV